MTKKTNAATLKRITTKKYLAKLEQLGLTPSGQATVAALGLKLRQCQRISAGDREVPETVALLLDMYLKHGVPAWVREIADNAKAAMLKT
jgi:hypothetical protein